MEQHITIARPAAAVFAYLAKAENMQVWLPQLRRDETSLPRAGLDGDAAAGRLRWSFDPAGEWQVEDHGKLTVLRLLITARSVRPNDPTERETPEQALAHGMEAALQSLKSHLEQAGGGDPELPMPDADQRVYGHKPAPGQDP
ncbi:SRPBCC family protein [Roseomonas sp. 18066]|uniref:SRPBCC family protein n=1 Tax=Roseomonas sp. 18066 TaxID=2681412 RepID=UPI00135CB665|nr:SRPBCC family protein [Roseomonas sp. 18066]